MNHLQFNTYLRGELGRNYSVADEESGVDGTLQLIVLRRGKEETLVVNTAEGWLRNLQTPPATEDRVLVKHLAIYIKRFFAHPERLPEHGFPWPGTAQSRGAIRLALDPRQSRRGAARAQEG